MLTGRFVDVDGRAVDGAVVTLAQGGRGIVRTTTDANGIFSVSDVAAGTYRLACGSAAGNVRCWPSDAAPPNAVDGEVTFQDGVIRGQAALLVPAMSTGTLVSGAATAGAVVSGVSISGLQTGSSERDHSSIVEPAEPPTTTGVTPIAPRSRPETIARMARLSHLNARSLEIEYRQVNGRLIRVPRPSGRPNPGLADALRLRDPFAPEEWDGEFDQGEIFEPASP